MTTTITSSPLKPLLGLTLLVLTTCTLSIHLDRLRTRRARAALDSDVDSVLDFWFSGSSAKMWFVQDEGNRGEMDALVQGRFGGLLERLRTREAERNEWFARSEKATLALIIVLDQFSRHVCRGDEDRIAKCDCMARDVLHRALRRGDVQVGSKLSFMLMPYRHRNPTIQELELVLQIVDASERVAIDDKQTLSRFKRATETRLSTACAEAERDTGSNGRKRFTDQDILEPHPAPNPDDHLTEESRGPVYKLVEQYLNKYAKENSFVLVSLSGGVDSMVLADILCHIIRTKKLNVDVVAAHVDYGNRGESHQEAEFVNRWCQANGIQCFVQRVEGLLRGVTERDEYEEKSREIRFDLYRRIWASRNCLVSKPIVLFGHHEGDVVENVLSNALKGKTILELSGMTSESAVSGCVVRRPLLPITKGFVFDYSHRFGIPYFKDTTPRWSTRGQVRMEVLPVLERVYGKGFQNHLARLAEQSDEAFAFFVRDFIDHVVVSNLRFARNTLIAYVADLTEEISARPVFLWRLALRRAAHDHGILVATDKAVKNLYDTVVAKQKSIKSALLENGFPPSEGFFVELRHGSRSYVHKLRHLIVLRFDKDACVPYHLVKLTNVLRFNEEVRFGCWTLRIERAETSNKSFVYTMEDFWSTFVCNERGDYPMVRYSIPSSMLEVYRLALTLRTIPCLNLDLALRNVLLPCIWPEAEDTRIEHARDVVVVATWIGAAH